MRKAKNVSVIHELKIWCENINPTDKPIDDDAITKPKWNSIDDANE